MRALWGSFIISRSPLPHLEQAGGGEHGGAHAVTDKEDDVLGIGGVRLGEAAKRAEQGGADQRLFSW